MCSLPAASFLSRAGTLSMFHEFGSDNGGSPFQPPAVVRLLRCTDGAENGSPQLSPLSRGTPRLMRQGSRKAMPRFIEGFAAIMSPDPIRSSR